MIFTHSELTNPNGIFIDNSGRLFTIDSRYDNKTKKDDGVLYELHGTNALKGVSNLNLKLPFGLTGDGEGLLFISDWSLGSIERIEIDKKGLKKSQKTLLKGFLQPMGVLYVKLKSKPIKDQTCTIKSCDICLKIGEKNTKRCYCNGYGSKLLSADKNSCKGN